MIRVGQRVTYIPDEDAPNKRPKGIELDTTYKVKTKYREGDIGTKLFITVEGAFGNSITLAEKNFKLYEVI